MSHCLISFGLCLIFSSSFRWRIHDKSSCGIKMYYSNNIKKYIKIKNKIENVLLETNKNSNKLDLQKNILKHMKYKRFFTKIKGPRSSFWSKILQFKLTPDHYKRYYVLKITRMN